MFGGFGSLIEIAQIPAHLYGGTGIEADTTHHHLILSTRQIAQDELIADDRHITVEEEQIVVLGRLGEEVADSSAPSVLLATDELAAG